MTLKQLIIIAVWKTMDYLSMKKKIIERYFNGDKVLDIGCGTGRTTSKLNEMGFDVIGIDYSKGMIMEALEKHPHIKFEIGDCSNLRFEDESFNNVIFSFNGIMLEKDYNIREKMFNEIYRVLLPRGIFFFTTPYLDNKIDLEYWREKIKNNNLNLSKKEDRILLGDELIEEDGVQFFIHIPFCEEIENMLKKTGFKCINRGARIDDFHEGEVEEILDDNYYWVVIK